jgi:hypothetical protein
MLMLPPPLVMPSARFLPSIQGLGQSSGLQMVYDAADIRSTDGTAQQWTDLMGNYHVQRGTTSGAEGSDPTFNGAAGELAAYFSFDGGDYFTGPAVTTFINSLHQNNALGTIVAWVYFADMTSANNPICGTNRGGGTNVGFYFGWNTTDVLRFQVNNAAGSVLTFDHASGISLNTWTFVSLSINEATPAYAMGINGSYTTGSTAYSSPSAAGASSPMQIGAFGANVGPITSGGRMGCVAFWNTALTQAQMTAIYNRTRRRFGV